jgi:hypothetical protein
MKNNKQTFLAIFILICVALGWWAFSKMTPTPVAKATKSQIGMTPTTSPIPDSPATPSVPPVYPDPSAAPDAEATQRALASGEKGQMGLAIMQLANAQRIDFYGRIVDQNGQPVSDVKVEGSTLLVLGADNSGGNYYHTVSDGEGKFSFLDAHGNGMGFKFDKPGYEYNYRQAPGWTSNYKPDPENPKIFILWKLKGAEHLIHDQEFYGLQADGRTYSIDLIKGTASARDLAGDIYVNVQRPRPAQIRANQKFDWSLSMEIKGGGFIESNDYYLNEAPADGYKSHYALIMSASDPKWKNELQDKLFYIKTRDGRVFGYIKIEVIPNYNDVSVVKFESYVNPAGSRNLEIDASKVTKAENNNPAP